MKAHLAAYLATLGVASSPKIKGQFLPFGHFHKTPGRGAILLAGDAAGLVDPITGEGIAYALKSGQLAAQAAIEAMAARAPQNAYRFYRKSLKPIHRNLRMARALRSITFSKHVAPAFDTRLKTSGQLRQDFMGLLAGDLEYPEIMPKTLRRLPALLLARQSIKRRASPN